MRQTQGDRPADSGAPPLSMLDMKFKPGIEPEEFKKLREIYDAAWHLCDDCEETTNVAPAARWEALRTALDSYEEAYPKGAHGFGRDL